MSDQQYKEQGATIGFGPGQLSNPTPMAARWIFRIILALSGLWALIAPQFTELPEQTLAEINKWLLVSNVLVNWLIKLFGWDFTPDN